MSVLPSGISLLSPAWLLMIPAIIAGLVYAYRRRGRGPSIRVGTTFILKQLERQSSFRRTFAPPPRFFFELLLLSLLSLIAAGLAFTGGERRIAIVIDTSFSMFAHTQDRAPTRSRIDEARDEIREFLGSLTPFSKVELFTSAPELRSLTGGLVTPASAARAVTSITAAYAEDRLEGELTRLIEEDTFESIYLWTDRRAATGEQNSIPSNVLINSLVPREQLGNIAVTGIRFVREPGAQTPAIEVSVTSYNSSNVSASVTLRRHIGSPEPLPAGQQLVNLPPHQPTAVRFSQLKSAEAYSVQLLVGTTRSPTRTNAIVEDDVAFIGSPTARRVVRVVSPLSLQELGLESISSFEFVRTPAADTLPTPTTGENPLYLLHRVLPATLPAGDTLIIAPPAGTGGVEVRDLIQNVTPTRWIESHPLVTYAKLALLNLSEARTIRPLSWFEEIITSADGPLLVAGEHGGYRYAVVGFELLPFEGKRSPLLSVLLLNGLSWLSNSGFDSAYRMPYAPLDDARIVALTSPRGREQDLSRLTERTQLLTEVGLYQVRRTGTPPALLAVSFINEAESDLQATPVNIAAGVSLARQPSVRGSTALVWLALLLIVGDMCVALVRRRL